MTWTSRIVTLLGAVAALWSFGATQALAQKGMGEPVGVARQAVRPELVSLSGKVTAVESGPCKLTTGRAGIGTHVILATEDGGALNVHLGPQAAVATLAERLKPGSAVHLSAFRTDKMPEDHYVAKSLTLGEETIPLRDASLRPAWAAARGAGRVGLPGNAAAGFGTGRGTGRAPGGGQGLGPRGLGPGQGNWPANWNCPRWGGPPQGAGPGWGPARQGRGPGWGGARQGPGFGRGPAR